ncbi:MAG: DUF3592 domain-containing protein [Deltaproteobacteria bacterium]|nr:MAG: DUF3592 domain-containing protein [Deltaproteobacteria bacterium]
MKVFNILKYVFGGVGLVLLGLAFFFWNQTENFLRRSARAQGKVIRLVRRHSRGAKPVVSFKTKKGQTIVFTSRVASRPPAYRKGEVVRVVYDRSNPRNARIYGYFELYLLPTIFGGIGSVFFVMGGLFGFVTFRKRRRDLFLRQHGQQVYATFVEVRLNRHVRVNNRHPFQIVGEWVNPMNGETYIFVSDNIWEDPSRFIPDELPVWIDPKNPKLHLMDLRFLPSIVKR